MAFLEKNMIWLNAVITIAPMLGFTGTVVGMIAAFDAIKAANDISPAVVAGGISQALLTTAFGLIVLAFTWMQLTLVVNTFISTAIALTQLKEETGSISSVAEGYLEYVGTTDPVTTPLPISIAFLAVVGIIILAQIWMPKK